MCNPGGEPRSFTTQAATRPGVTITQVAKPYNFFSATVTATQKATEPTLRRGFLDNNQPAKTPTYHLSSQRSGFAHDATSTRCPWRKTDRSGFQARRNSFSHRWRATAATSLLWIFALAR